LKQTSKAQIRILRYAAAKHQRITRYASKGLTFRSYSEIISKVERDGYAVVRKVFDPVGLLHLGEKLEEALSAGIVEPISRAMPEAGKAPVLSDQEVQRGEDYITAHANIAYVRDPLIHCPGAVQYVFAEPLIDMATEFYGCPPAVTNCNIMKSFANDLPASAFNHFHMDSQSKRFLKFFLYLNDVGIDGGPFCYVEGSHRRKPFAWRRQYRWSEDEMIGFYGENAIHYATARVGDVVVANPTGFHRGFKVRKAPRRMLMINTGLHGFDSIISSSRLRLKKEQWERFDAKQKAAADLLDIV
jgi:ectoine hydroxylase-related dioxygenase (phytanoyl-CoA dioxygenase family)